MLRGETDGGHIRFDNATQGELTRNNDMGAFTDLTVMSERQTLTTVQLCVVDSRSSKLSTSKVPVEDEEIIQLNSTHVGAPRFIDEDKLYSFYIEEICSFVKGSSAEERDAYHQLNNNNIMTGIEVDVHQFYVVGPGGEPGSIKILSAHPTLQTFLEQGPKKCMKARIRGNDPVSPPIPPASNGSMKPTTDLVPPTLSIAPTLTVTTIDVADS